MPICLGSGPLEQSCLFYSSTVVCKSVVGLAEGRAMLIVHAFVVHTTDMEHHEEGKNLPDICTRSSPALNSLVDAFGEQQLKQAKLLVMNVVLCSSHLHKLHNINEYRY